VNLLPTNILFDEAKFVVIVQNIVMSLNVQGGLVQIKYEFLKFASRCSCKYDARIHLDGGRIMNDMSIMMVAINVFDN